MHSAQLARLAGVSTDTLRYYERLRLLPAAPRSASGYRQFPSEALTRVRLIRGALPIGFSVRELAAIFAERDSGGAPCHRVRALAQKKLAAVEVSLRNLQIWRPELKATLAEWDRPLRKTPVGARRKLRPAMRAHTSIGNSARAGSTLTLGLLQCARNTSLIGESATKLPTTGAA
jgi:MerR family transcriptional regulator, copper efflux regulator